MTRPTATTEAQCHALLQQPLPPPVTPHMSLSAPGSVHDSLQPDDTFRIVPRLHEGAARWTAHTDASVQKPFPHGQTFAGTGAIANEHTARHAPLHIQTLLSAPGNHAIQSHIAECAAISSILERIPHPAHVTVRTDCEAVLYILRQDETRFTRTLSHTPGAQRRILKALSSHFCLHQVTIHRITRLDTETDRHVHHLAHAAARAAAWLSRPTPANPHIRKWPEIASAFVENLQDHLNSHGQPEKRILRRYGLPSPLSADSMDLTSPDALPHMLAAALAAGIPFTGLLRTTPARVTNQSIPMDRPPPIYAAIGTRNLPPAMLPRIRHIAAILAAEEWTLATAATRGTNAAFVQATPPMQTRLYDSWPEASKQHVPAHVLDRHQQQLCQGVIASHHPTWERCNEHARMVHARNAAILLGPDANRPANALLYWYPHPIGTPPATPATLARLARSRGIPALHLDDYGDATLLSRLRDIAAHANHTPYAPLRVTRRRSRLLT